MRVEFSLFGIGWLAATLTDETASATVTASDLSDAPGDLLLAVWTLLDGDAQARCSWQEEPGEYRWLFARQGDLANLRILSFNDAHPREPDQAGRMVFDTTQPVLSMAEAFADAASKLLDEYGIEGYKAKWMGGEFPEETLTSIRQILAMGSGERRPTR
jgi:hypothetical protein